MIATPPIYNQNESQIANDLLPIRRRQPKFIAWLTSIMNPIQWIHDLSMIAYYGGSDAPVFQYSTPYLYGQRVIYIDGSVYELQNLNGFTTPPPPTFPLYLQYSPGQDPSNWLKVLDTWIGVAERVQYTGQKVMMEYLLNNYFSIISPSIAPSLPFKGASHSSQVFIENNPVPGIGFFMGDGNQPLQAYMNNNSSNSQYFMNDFSYALGQFDFTIWVPTAVDNDITIAQNPLPTPLHPPITSEMVVLALAGKYAQAGIFFNYHTY